MQGSERNKLLIGEFSDPREASEAYYWLRERGYESREVNLMMSDAALEEFNTYLKDVSGNGTNTISGLAIGAAIGATVAGIMSVAVPGVGLVFSGPLFAALGGAGAGTITGGLIGGMMDLSIPESQATAYEQTIGEGGVILAVVPHEGDQEVIREYLERVSSKDVAQV